MLDEEFMQSIVHLLLCSAGDFMKPDAQVPIYEDITNMKELKQFMENALEDYNMTPGVIGMNLVLFHDAIQHGKRDVHKLTLMHTPSRT